MENKEIQTLANDIKQYKKSQEEIKDVKKYSNVFFPFFEKLFLSLKTNISDVLSDIKSFLKSENIETRKSIKETVNELKEIKNKVPNHSEVLDDILSKLSTLSPKDYKETLTELSTLLKDIKEKKSIPDSLIDDDRVKIKLSDEQIKELKKITGRSAYPYVSAVDQETKNILTAIRDNTAGFDIPPYDTQEIDESGAPATTIITYKKDGSTVATKTITVSGTTTTINVT